MFEGRRVEDEGLTVEDVGGGRLLPDVGVGLGRESEVGHDGGG